MKTLFINACVREDSRTLVLCRAYQGKHCVDTIVQEVHLPSMRLRPLDGEMLKKRERDIQARDFSDACYELAKTFAAADEILIAAPYWDCSFPAILKVYLEHVCVNKITFGYRDDQPVGLCRAKKLVYITTAGGYLEQNSSLMTFWQEVCTMFGIPELRVCKAEGLDLQGNDVNAILRRAIEAF